MRSVPACSASLQLDSEPTGIRSADPSVRLLRVLVLAVRTTGAPHACVVSPPTVWYAYEAVSSFAWALAFTVTAVYFVTEVGMSPLELVLVGT